MSKLYGEKCLFMNFYWMYISVSHFNTFGRQTAETTLLGFYFPVEFSPSFRRQCQNVANRKWDALPFLWLHAHQKFVIKIIRPNEALHHTLVYNLRFICVAVTFDNAFMDISIVFNVGIERTSRQFMVSKEAKKRNRRNAKANDMNMSGRVGQISRRRREKRASSIETKCLIWVLPGPTKINVPFRGNKHH